MNRTKINQKANREMREQCYEKEIYYCEARISNGCWRAVTYAHRHKRNWYKDKSNGMLWNYKQWILACPLCHEKMEKDKKLTEEIFLRLRGEE